MIRPLPATLAYLKSVAAVPASPAVAEVPREVAPTAPPARTRCWDIFQFEGNEGCACTLSAGHDEKFHECEGFGRWKNGEFEKAVDIIKTWPTVVPPKTVAKIFGPEAAFSDYYFTLGRGRPKRPIRRLWFTYSGRIIGSFQVDRIIQNVGQLPRLRRLSGEEGGWQIRSGAWVAICGQGCERNRERLAYPGFRGYRYFSLEDFRSQGAAW